MSRLSFRPRPLDIYKKLPIVKSVKDLDGDDNTASRNLPQSSSNGADADTELVCFCCRCSPFVCDFFFMLPTHSLTHSLRVPDVQRRIFVYVVMLFYLARKKGIVVFPGFLKTG
jgi:hypothetical protein